MFPSCLNILYLLCVCVGGQERPIHNNKYLPIIYTYTRRHSGGNEMTRVWRPFAYSRAMRLSSSNLGCRSHVPEVLHRKMLMDTSSTPHKTTLPFVLADFQTHQGIQIRTRQVEYKTQHNYIVDTLSVRSPPDRVTGSNTKIYNRITL